jgi:hypothetical protein
MSVLLSGPTTWPSPSWDLQVYTTGVALTLVIRVRPSSRLGGERALNELIWEHGPGPGRFLLGIELSDGRRATGMPLPDQDGDLVLHSSSGSGGQASVEQSWWLSPLPPEHHRPPPPPDVPPGSWFAGRG